MSIVINIECSSGEGCQILENVPIPVVGSVFQFSSSRDQRTGDYRQSLTRFGDVKKVFKGVVNSVSYLYEELGSSPASWSGTMYVTVKCDPIF
jgi:hypothetical protein